MYKGYKRDVPSVPPKPKLIEFTGVKGGTDSQFLSVPMCPKIIYLSQNQKEIVTFSQSGLIAAPR